MNSAAGARPPFIGGSLREWEEWGGIRSMSKIRIKMVFGVAIAIAPSFWQRGVPQGETRFRACFSRLGTAFPLKAN
jgi:hypothetical protein